MASASEQLAANMNLGVFSKAKELQKRLLFTLSGGAVERMAIFALNVMPYISASIIMTLLKGSVASLKELDKDGEQD